MNYQWGANYSHEVNWTCFVLLNKTIKWQRYARRIATLESFLLCRI